MNVCTLHVYLHEDSAFVILTFAFLVFRLDSFNCFMSELNATVLTHILDIDIIMNYVIIFLFVSTYIHHYLKILLRIILKSGSTISSSIHLRLLDI